jgi:nitrite reductase/ring-hydroxylating ferredoxin subunit/uncharacterized membrane protein
MRSRAHFKAHPIHPALIPFPFAFLWGAALFDLLYLVSDAQAFTITASHLTVAGLIAGVLAAIPGAIDYIYAVPPESSGKKRATKHALGNSTALLLFLGAWLLREPDGSAAMPTVALEVLGAALMGYASLLGGELVVRNMISVDHRYANKGKWKEATFSAAVGERIVVADEDELEAGHMKLLRVNGRRIALARTAEGYCAFEDHCTHRGGSLAGGVLVGTTVQCLWHGSQFDVRSGSVLCGPARERIHVFETAVAKGQVHLVTPPNDPLADR